MIQVAESWFRKLKCAEADVIKSLIVENDSLISVLDELMEG